ncbi:OmpA family protein [Tabrizicola piscis]|uniref:OmpA family protein n=1 Tax=Tabrizicola piscis TaxID=2494374 RepID=A0A3S8U5Z8_9RHOB|nr:OmpA family protein [Tabrizicola piscis]AZL58985.1 OmpA family protein [Tabrizicola piscis]
MVSLSWALAALPAAALTLNLPAKVIGEERRSEVPGSYALPLAPFDGVSVPSRPVEGALDQRAFQLEAPDQTTLAVMGPLRDQVVAAGFTVLLDCDARACGGFDFRFGTEVMPEPDMHVDMGDFRFLSAEREDEAISILVSRSAFSAFVQVTRVTPAPLPDAPTEAVVDLNEVERPRSVEASPAIAAALDTVGSAVLDDLVFASGAATLSDGDYPSLAAVAAWLEANPDATIALVGHTDASGSLAANIAISEQRAEAVAQALIDLHGVDRVRIASEGVGFLAPRDTNQTEEGRQKNRRVEVIVTSTR